MIPAVKVCLSEHHDAHVFFGEIEHDGMAPGVPVLFESESGFPEATPAGGDEWPCSEDGCCIDLEWSVQGVDSSEAFWMPPVVPVCDSAVLPSLEADRFAFGSGLVRPRDGPLPHAVETLQVSRRLLI